LLQHPRSDMGWRRWHLGGILIGAIAPTIREADRSPIDDDLGGDAGCLKVADCSPTASRCRMPASNGLHPVESTTHNGRCCRAGLRYVLG
ncbi:hypothetical protein, partial [Burkholderia cepacia]|uniref:hypothetical protein n=1 Tax=Burkholderia cepacia TaxID=292 RepID=UPI001E50A005